MIGQVQGVHLLAQGLGSSHRDGLPDLLPDGSRHLILKSLGEVNELADALAEKTLSDALSALEQATNQLLAVDDRIAELLFRYYDRKPSKSVRAISVLRELVESEIRRAADRSLDSLPWIEEAALQSLILQSTALVAEIGRLGRQVRSSVSIES